MENLVLFIDKEKFIRNLVEELFIGKNSKIHTIDNISENFYLIEDLRPSVLVFDVLSVGDSLEEILALKNIKLIAIGQEAELLKVQGRVNLLLAKPLKVSTLFETIMN